MRDLEPARKLKFLTYYLAIVGHISDIVFVISVLPVDYRFGFIGIMLLSLRLVLAIYVFMAEVPGIENAQLGMLMFSGGHLENTIGFITSGFLADNKFFTCKINFEPILQSNYLL